MGPYRKGLAAPGCKVVTTVPTQAGTKFCSAASREPKAHLVQRILCKKADNWMFLRSWNKEQNPSMDLRED